MPGQYKKARRIEFHKLPWFLRILHIILPKSLGTPGSRIPYSVILAKLVHHAKTNTVLKGFVSKMNRDNIKVALIRLANNIHDQKESI